MDYLEKTVNIFENTGKIYKFNIIEGANKTLKAIQCVANIFEFFTKNDDDKLKFSKFSCKINIYYFSKTI